MVRGVGIIRKGFSDEKTRAVMDVLLVLAIVRDTIL